MNNPVYSKDSMHHYTGQCCYNHINAIDLYQVNLGQLIITITPTFQ